MAAQNVQQPASELSHGQEIELSELSPSPALPVVLPLDGPHSVVATPSPTRVNGPLGEREKEQEVEKIPRWPFLCLILQHFSSAWNERSFEFSAYLYLVILFPTTLVPASLLGLIVTGASLIGAGWVGGLIDEKGRLAFVRWAIGVQKLSTAIAYAVFIVLFVPLKSSAATAWSPSPTALSKAAPGDTSRHGLVYFCLAIIIVSSSIAGLASGGLNVSVQRDWVVTISKESDRHLTTFNTWLRRVDLLCKLLAPLFVSLLTTAVSYPFSLYFLFSLSSFTFFSELLWIGVVWRAFPVLEEEESKRVEARHLAREEAKRAVVDETKRRRKSMGERWATGVEGLRQMGRDWKEFGEHPVFLSSLSISLVYLTTLSFDGIMLSYLKSQRSFSDPFIAGMRGVGVVAGLAGTILMPWLERKVGLVRGGAWSLWSEIFCLLPPLLTLYIGLPSVSPPGQGPDWNIALFFTFIALSRVGLWSFDLIQLQILQVSLRDHPRRNRLTSLQLSLQSAFDLAKYGVVLGLNRPSDFKHTALVSFIACSIAGIVFLFFLRRMRGHILPHWKWLGLPSAREAGHEGTGNSTAVDGGKGKGGDELGLRKRKVEEEDGLGSGGGKP